MSWNFWEDYEERNSDAPVRKQSAKVVSVVDVRACTVQNKWALTLDCNHVKVVTAKEQPQYQKTTCKLCEAPRERD